MNDLSSILPRSTSLITRGIEEGLHTGVQLYISQNRAVIADTGFGESRPGIPMDTDTIMLWMSSTKPITAVAIASLWQDSLVDLDTAVCHYVPDFAKGGKQDITIRHLLTHTAGIRNSEIMIRGMTDESEIIRMICASGIEPGWVPGRRAGYHLSSSWYMLGEIVHRVSGRPINEYVREKLFEPLGMTDSWIGMPGGKYRDYGTRIGYMYNTEGVRPVLNNWHDESDCALVSPGGNGRGPIRELGYFYEMLLQKGERNGVEILSPQTVESLTARHRSGMKDRTFIHELDWGLGFLVDSNRYGPETVPYSFGRHCSMRTYGHGGRQSSSSFTDPEHRLVVTVVFNGMPGERKHNERIREINTAIYEDLALTSIRET